MEKLRNDKNLPEQTEEFSHPDDWWLDEEDSADGLPVFDPDEAEDYAKDRQRLMGVPMVTGYEALERHRGVRRPRRKLSRREKRAWKKAQKYEMKLHKAHEKEERKLAKQAAKQAAREEKAAQKQAKKEEKHKKKTKPSGSVKSSGKKGTVRKCALDQRLLNDMLPDAGESKVNACVENAFQVWEDGKDTQATQLIFCDLSTPKNDGTFNVYDDVRNKLVERGIPKEEIAFIHEYNTEVRKAELFAKVRAGQVRILMGSTPKLGAGTNVQDRLLALHHLDCPWKPSDLEQQEGRILRQGNQNDKVKIFRYVTENTFDSYMWQILENKQKFISQIMTSKSPVRACEDVDDTALSYAEIKALATGNEYIKEKMDLDVQVSKLKLLKANHTSQIYRLESDIAKRYPVQITALKEKIAGMRVDADTQQFGRA